MFREYILLRSILVGLNNGLCVTLYTLILPLTKNLSLVLLKYSRTLMTASRGTSTGSQLVIHRANVILSLVQHDGSYCQSIRDANHVSFAHHVSQETLILAKDQNVIHRHESLLEISHTELFQYLIQELYF